MLSLNNQLPAAAPTSLPSPTESPKTNPTAPTKRYGFQLASPSLADATRHSRFPADHETTPSLNAMREQVQNDAWKKRDGVASGELTELLNTPIGKEMSQALQVKFGGSNFNALTWGMAGLASLMVNLFADNNNYYIDGFDWGGNDKNPAAIFEHLKEFLVEKGLATPELAGAMAYVRLWRPAPEFLLRNIPADVDKDSPEWSRVSEKVESLVLDNPLLTLGIPMTTYSTL